MLEHPTSCYIQHSLPTLCLTANRSTVCSRMQRLLPARLSAEGCGTAIFRECPALARMVVPFSINTHCFALHIQLEVAINPTKPPSSADLRIDPCVFVAQVIDRVPRSSWPQWRCFESFGIRPLRLQTK